MLSFTSLVAAAACWSSVSAHTVITYPGWRGNNLHTNGTVPGLETYEDGVVPVGSLGINHVKENGSDSYSYPYGMQWMYPCGGMPTSTNRTKWPVGGGAVALQPGWFKGHSKAFFYINLGLGTEPINMSHPMVPVFEIIGPTNDMYKGEFCLPQVPLPTNLTVNIGDNATIQIIETAQHGASLYNCVDITFADPKDVDPVNETNCRNSTDPGQNIKFDMVFTTTDLDSSAFSLHMPTILPTTLLIALAAFWI